MDEPDSFDNPVASSRGNKAVASSGSDDDDHRTPQDSDRGSREDTNAVLLPD
eukprot:SAG22_NODE_6785_length_811_cov_1.362360_1_plen_51_part_01